MSGWAIRRSSYHALGHLFTFQLSIRKDHQLVTSGPYAVVRHPSYTGITMCMAGATISLLVPGSWIMECSGALGTNGRGALNLSMTFIGTFWGPIIFLLFKRMGKEDELLRQNFKEQWEAWRVRVPYKLIPGVY